MPPDERDVWEKEVAAFGEAVGELNKKVYTGTKAAREERERRGGGEREKASYCE